MAIAETAKLVSSLELNTKQFDAGVRRAGGSLAKLSGSIAKSRAVAVGLGVGLERVAEKGISALGNAIGDGIASAQTLEKAQAATAAVIKSTDGAAGQTTDSIRALAEAQESLTTADDRSVQQGENLLLTFTNIGQTVFPDATKAMVNMAIAMNKGDAATADFDGTAIQLGKALNDPAKGFTALARAGVSFTEEQKAVLKGSAALTKEETKHYQQLKKNNKAAAEQYRAGRLNEHQIAAQKLILAELNKEFGEAGKAAGEGFTGDINRANDAIEDSKVAIAQGLIPAVGEVARELTTTLSDPAVQSGLKDLGRGLGDAIKGAVAFAKTVPWGTIASSLQAAAGFAKDLLNAFLGLPSWVQAAVITGWGLNKITGGALGNIVSSLASGLIKGVLGINAGVVNVNAASVGGAGAAGGIGGASILGLIGAASIAAIVSKTVTEIANTEFANAGQKTNFAAPGSGGDNPLLAVLPFGIGSAIQNLGEGFRLLTGGAKGAKSALTDLEKRADATLGGHRLDSGIVPALEGTKANKGRTSFSNMEANRGRMADELAKAELKVPGVEKSVGALQGKVTDDLANVAMTAQQGLTNVGGDVTRSGNLLYAGQYGAAAGIIGAIQANRPNFAINVDISGTTLRSTVSVNDRGGSPDSDRTGNTSLYGPGKRGD